MSFANLYHTDTSHCDQCHLTCDLCTLQPIILHYNALQEFSPFRDVVPAWHLVGACLYLFVCILELDAAVDVGRELAEVQNWLEEIRVFSLDCITILSK